jgi:V/A-type H+/Na+-transporting ATPase subunit E
MAVELQHLIDRINREAIEKADEERERILAHAKERAATLVREAEAAAKARLEKADLDAQVYVERSTRTLEQAARDLLITVGQAVEGIVQGIVGEATGDALDPATLRQMMVKMAQAYAERNGTEGRIEFLIGESDKEEIMAFFAEQYRQHLVSGLTVKPDRDVIKGFRVILKDERIYHDFTKPAIAEALGNFLRPHLAEIVHRAARAASASDQA